MSASKEPPKDYMKLIGGTSLREEIEKEDHSYLNPPKPTMAERIQARLDGLPGKTEGEKLDSLMKQIAKKRHMMGKFMPKKYVKLVKEYAMHDDPNTPEAEKVIKKLTDAGFTPQDFIFTAAMIPAMHNADKDMKKMTGVKMTKDEMIRALSLFANWGLPDCEQFWNEWMTEEGLRDNPFAQGGDDDDDAA